MTDLELLNHYIDSPDETPSLEWVERMGSDYPYLVTPKLLLLKRGKHMLSTGQYDAVLGQVALMYSDRTALAEQLGVDASRFAGFYPEPKSEAAADTNSAIDKFLDRYCEADSREVAALENMIFNPTPEYALTLDQTDAVPSQHSGPMSEQDRLIDSFLSNSPELGVDRTAEPEPPAIPADVEPIAPAEERLDDSTLFSESLANVYIKQKKYAKAYDILQAVRSSGASADVHIADRLRFLRKLIALQGGK